MGQTVSAMGFVYLVIAVVWLGHGCSRDAIQRTTYEALQDIEDQRCRKDLTAECAQRKSYEQYQRERHSVQSEE